jgi:hypothetical protein
MKHLKFTSIQTSLDSSFNPRHVLQVQILHRANKKEGEKNSAKRGPLFLRNQKTLQVYHVRKERKKMPSN